MAKLMGGKKGHICDYFAAKFHNGTTKQRLMEQMLQLLPVPADATKGGFCPN